LLIEGRVSGGIYKVGPGNRWLIVYRRWCSD